MEPLVFIKVLVNKAENKTVSDDCYLHPLEDGYVVNPGMVGAAIWKKSAALRLIKQCGLKNTVLIDAKTLLQSN